jgi:D-alanyl-D-alanine carboxypeptidase (penicillin-binding protein 5/6)
VAALAAAALIPVAAVAPAATPAAASSARSAIPGTAPAAASPARAAVPGTAPAAARAAVPGTAKAAPGIPCPKPDVKPPAGRPPRPKPPADDPVLRAVGGDSLATDGLVTPSGAAKPPAVTATSWLVADLGSGEVLGGCGPHVYGTPASVQKLLLAATAMPKLDPKATTTITQGDVTIDAGSSAVGLVRGGKYNVATLWTGLLLNSGNDAANTLARLAGGGGGVPAAVAAMNAEAKRLGAYQTHAVTPSGLDGPGQFTSAYDLALIARVCFARPDFIKYALTKTFQMPAQKKQKKGGFQIQNENKLIFEYKGALGGKTGFTTLARHSYVGGAERNGRRLVVTLLGAEASPDRGYRQGEKLLDWGFALPKDASVGKLVAPDATGTADSGKAAAPPAEKQRETTKAAVRNAPPRALSFGAAAAVAIVLAVTPLLLLITQRRRRRVRRRRPWTEPTFR